MLGVNIMTIHSKEIYKGQRNKEKRELFKRFRFWPIADVYKRKFFMLFDNRCFKCGVKEKKEPEIGKPPVLCIDHHVPMILGGHLVLGNLVSLCRSCNNFKHDSRPEIFYTKDELTILRQILDKQKDLFDFTFDWDRWNDDREDYLLGIGVKPELVHNLLYNKEYLDYIGVRSSRGVVISIDVNER